MDRTDVHIYDSYPLQGVRFPSIIVNVGGGDVLLRGIGEEIAEEDTVPFSVNGLTHNRQVGRVYSGNLNLHVTLSIYARNSYERAAIADWVTLFLRHFAVDKFRREGVEIQSMTMGAQSVELVGADPVYSTSLDVTVLTSFYREITQTEAGTLLGICLSGVFTSLPDGATVGESFVI